MYCYGDFAKIYNTFMEAVPYGRWITFIEDIWRKNNLKVYDVLDLGCGTGNVSILLSKKGYGVVGVDLSLDMLAVAKDNTCKENLDILFLNQDMREFELYGTVESVICICDSINYILEKDEVLQVFKLVNNYLSPGGLFVFDINSEYKYKKILRDNMFSQSFNEGAYIWENYYNEDDKINEYSLDFFIETEHGYYERFEEVHYQRSYCVDEIKSLLLDAGFEIVGIYDDYKFENINNETLRACFVARVVK